MALEGQLSRTSASAKIKQLVKPSNWCRQPIEWEVTEEGHLVIPKADATYRCEERPRWTYVLRRDKFFAY